jgi:hypothetical protein
MNRRCVRGLIGPLALAAPAALADVPALELAASFSPTVGIDVDDAGRIAVWGPPAEDGAPQAAILLPPHPGGGELVPPCNVDPDCYGSHEWHVPMRFARSGRLLGRIMEFGSAGPYWYVPATWSGDGTVTQRLAPLPGSVAAGQVDDGNASGLLVGTIPSAALVATPVTWSSPTAVPVALDTGGVAAGLGPFPARVNDADEIVGSTTGTEPRAATWRVPGHVLAFLPTLPGGTKSHARGIDSSGAIVGSSDDGSGVEIAVVWTPDGSGWVVAPLPSPFPGGSCSQATAISDAGEIAGNCATAGGIGRGVLWREEANGYAFALVLAPLAGDAESAVFGLNEQAQAVGRSGPASSARAVLWTTAAPVPSLGPRSLAALALGLLAAAVGALAVRRAR